MSNAASPDVLGLKQKVQFLNRLCAYPHAPAQLTTRAASDTARTLVNRSGLDISALADLKDSGRPLRDHSRGEKLAADAILNVQCDIWIPAARPDVIRADNVHRLTPEAGLALHKRGTLVIPDFIANAGGVICAATEFQGGTERTAFEDIDQCIRTNTRLVIEESRRAGSLPRAAAEGLRRLREAIQTHRWR